MRKFDVKIHLWSILILSVKAKTLREGPHAEARRTFGSQAQRTQSSCPIDFCYTGYIIFKTSIMKV